jgi:predicted HicB family RNase H-like nuclease
MTIREKRADEIQRQAELLFSQNPDWVAFYREILGLHGVVRRRCSTRESLTHFEQTEAYRQIQQMLTRLRKKGPPAKDENDPTRVITVRLPKSLHDALMVEADEHHTTMNKLCISKLLQFIDGEMVPNSLESSPVRQGTAETEENT